MHPKCKKFTKLAFIIRLFHIKCLNGWSNKFTMLLKLLKKTLPKSEKLSSTYYETKKRLHELGLHYKKTHACPSNYLLYSKEHAYANECIVCGETRWKSGKGCSFDETNKSSQKKRKKTYF